MRMAGPREALWHGDHPQELRLHPFHRRPRPCRTGNDSYGKPFYGPYDAQELFAKHQDELGITMVPFQEMVYVEDGAQYMPGTRSRRT